MRLAFASGQSSILFGLLMPRGRTTVPHRPLLQSDNTIAQLGGFLGRKGDGEPGAKTIWLGMRDIAVFVQGARFAREFGMLG